MSLPFHIIPSARLLLASCSPSGAPCEFSIFPSRDYFEMRAAETSARRPVSLRRWLIRSALRGLLRLRAQPGRSATQLRERKSLPLCAPGRDSTNAGTSSSG